MPYSPNHIPAYRKHRASGQAIVTLNGRDHYVGLYGTRASKIVYDRLISEWMANNRTLPTVQSGGITMVELMAAFMDHAEAYYRNADGKPSSEVASFRDVFRIIKSLYAETFAADFSPLRLKATRQKMIEHGWARTNINRQVNRLKGFFKWAVENEHVQVSVYQALTTVPGLKLGRTEARETDPVKPVAETHVRTIMPHVSSQVAAMLELQLVTGMRSGEVTRMRACDIDMTGEDWYYQPKHHKTAHHGHIMKRPIVGRAKEIVKRFLTTNPQTYLFRPCDADAERREKLHAARKTPLSCGNRPGSNRKRTPAHMPGEFYNTAAYYHAVRMGCIKAFPWPGLSGRKISNLTAEELVELKAWRKAHQIFPHRIRHSVGTRARSSSGVEAAQAALGHRTLAATQIYAERSEKLALSVAKELAG